MADSTQPTQTEKVRSPSTPSDVDTGITTNGDKSQCRSEYDEMRPLESLGQTQSPKAAPLHSQELSLEIRRLRPVEVARILNSTALGTVISERQLYRHRTRAGYRIGDGRRVDLIRYAAWLIHERERRRAENVSMLDFAAGGRKRGKRSTVRPEHGRLRAVDVLARIESQDFRCALSGRSLEPEIASLDHIVPISKGGEHTIGNAQVLHKDVNRAKGTLTTSEFVEMCREVVTWADSDASGKQEL